MTSRMVSEGRLRSSRTLDRYSARGTMAPITSCAQGQRHRLVGCEVQRMRVRAHLGFGVWSSLEVGDWGQGFRVLGSGFCVLGPGLCV